MHTDICRVEIQAGGSMNRRSVRGGPQGSHPSLPLFGRPDSIERVRLDRSPSSAVVSLPGCARLRIRRPLGERASGVGSELYGAAAASVLIFPGRDPKPEGLSRVNRAAQASADECCLLSPKIPVRRRSCRSVAPTPAVGSSQNIRAFLHPSKRHADPSIPKDDPSVDPIPCPRRDPMCPFPARLAGQDIDRSRW